MLEEDEDDDEDPDEDDEEVDEPLSFLPDDPESEEVLPLDDDSLLVSPFGTEPARLSVR